MVTRTFKNMEYYIQYVEAEINAARMPKTFDAWVEWKKQCDTLRKFYTCTRYSEKTKSWPSWNIEATSEREAYIIADQRLRDFELHHTIQNKPGGRETTPEEQRAILMRKIENEEKAEKKAQEKKANRRSELMKKIQSELNLK